jgi:hypothetical protein
MKTKNRLTTALALLAIVTMSLMATACNDEEEPTVRSSGTEKHLTFGTGCKVTIKSNDKFTDDDWNKTCVKVVDAIMRGYNDSDGGEQVGYKNVFAAGAVVVLESGLSHNWEVKGGEIGVVHVKTASLDTVDFKSTYMIVYMETGSAGFAKVLPKKGLGNTPVFANVNRNYQIEDKKTSLSYGNAKTA